MRNTEIPLTLAAAALAFAALAFADTPGRHPRYVHARSDLRVALGLLRVQDEPNVMHHVYQADREIEQAIREIDHAAVIDHKDVCDNPPIDRGLDRRGRIHRALELVQAARNDISREEDNPRAMGWRDAAYRHIDRAVEELRRAIRDLHMDRGD